MPVPYRIALVGLAPAERSLVEAAFLQAGPDGAGHEMVHDPARADLIILDADDGRAVQHFLARGLVAPVLLIGDDNAHTGWPAIPRPIECHALLDVAAWLLSGARADHAAAPSPPGFQATVPFAPLETPRLRGSTDGFDEPREFQATQPFERPPAGAPQPRRAQATRPVVHESIDARSVLLWRDAKDGASASSAAAQPAIEPASVSHAPAEATPLAPRRESPEAGLPAIAGFESTRDGDSVEHKAVPANWRELARQRDEERSQPVMPADAEAYSSSFADPSDHPTTPPGLAALARSPSILLVGETRLAGSSLVRELRGLGCQVDHAHDIETALARLAGQTYGFAILDDRSLGRQTRAVCRALRRRARALGQALKIVVMARDEGPLRRLLARWAGCDTWMTLPLERRRLARYLLGG
jgi:CheY-like chemotaxis protein